MQNQRQLRVGEQIRHTISEILLRGHFYAPALEKASTITVTEVRISPDLKNATAFVMPLGGVEIEEVVTALNETKGYFRSELGRKLELRYIPQITFRADTTFDEANRIEKLLQNERVQKDLKKTDT